MKRCPFCAEEIQDEAILCRYCKSDLSTPPQDIPIDNYLTVKTAYQRFLAELRKADAEVIKRYPLSLSRRPEVIDNIVYSIDDFHPSLRLPMYKMWWQVTAVKQPPELDWKRTAETVLKLTEDDKNFPSEDEWLTGIAFFLFRAVVQEGATDVWDYTKQWTSFRKAQRWDRFFRGFSAAGALMNIVSGFSPRKLPKEGSVDWRIYRRACAQTEALSILLSNNSSPNSVYERS